VFGTHLVERGPDAPVIVALGAPVNAMRVPAGTCNSVSARRRAAMNSRLSIMAAVSARWLTMEPERGRQAEPVSTANSSAV